MTQQYFTLLVFCGVISCVLFYVLHEITFPPASIKDTHYDNPCRCAYQEKMPEFNVDEI